MCGFETGGSTRKGVGDSQIPSSRWDGGEYDVGEKGTLLKYPGRVSARKNWTIKTSASKPKEAKWTRLMGLRLETLCGLYS